MSILAGAVALTLMTMAQTPKRIYEPVPKAPDFAFGADLSFAKQMEDRGTVYRDKGIAKPCLKIFRDHGYNWIRLRVFVEPVKEGLPNDLNYTLAMAKQAHELGYKFLLDFHYAQSWADPAKQPTPDAWASLSHSDRVTKVFEYTRDTIARFRQEGLLPDMVQIGNEVSVGTLWPDGKLPNNWDNFAEYLFAGINGVDAGRGNLRRPQIMVHYDNGGNQEGIRWFYDKLETYRLPFDVIGFSYYPWWHGNLQVLRENLNFAAKRYHKPVIVVETAYHFRESGETKGHMLPYPETPEGQAQFLEEVTRVVMNVPDGMGKGIFWWEPTLAAIGSRGMFDAQGEALPSVYALQKFAGH